MRARWKLNYNMHLGGWCITCISDLLELHTILILENKAVSYKEDITIFSGISRFLLSFNDDFYSGNI